MYTDLVMELRALSHKFAKMIATEDLSLQEALRASEMYLLLLAAKSVSLGGKPASKVEEEQCF